MSGPDYPESSQAPSTYLRKQSDRRRSSLLSGYVVDSQDEDTLHSDSSGAPNTSNPSESSKTVLPKPKPKPRQSAPSSSSATAKTPLSSISKTPISSISSSSNKKLLPARPKDQPQQTSSNRSKDQAQQASSTRSKDQAQQTPSNRHKTGAATSSASSSHSAPAPTLAHKSITKSKTLPDMRINTSNQKPATGTAKKSLKEVALSAAAAKIQSPDKPASGPSNQPGSNTSAAPKRMPPPARPAASRSIASSVVSDDENSIASRRGGDGENPITVDSDEDDTSTSHQRKDSGADVALKTARKVWKKAHDAEKARQSGDLRPLKKSSVVYLNFDEPQLSKDGVYLEFPCTCCQPRRLIPRPVTDSSTSNLWSHAKRYNPKHGQLGQLTLDEMFGRQAQIAADAKHLTAGMARQLAVYWVTEATRPIAIVEDKGFRAMLNQSQLSVMPKRMTVSRDITKVFKAMQQHITDELAQVQGCFHLAVDIWTSANGYAFLAVIIGYQQEGVAVRRVLEMVPFNEKHDADNLADIILQVTSKYEVTSRIWNVVSDNASENNAFMPLLAAKGGLPRYDLSSDNLSCRVRCCAHVLNLITKAVLKGFISKNGRAGIADNKEWDIPKDDEQSDETDSDDSGSSSEDDDQLPAEDEDEFVLSASLHPEALDDVEDDAQVDGILAAAKDKFLGDDDAISEEAQRKVNKRNKEMGQIIKKVAWLAITLRKSGPKSRDFKRHCVKMGCRKPHGLLRDVATLWDSTVLACERALTLIDGIISFCEQPGSPIPKDKRLRRTDEADLRKLVQLLKPISQATKKFSEMSTPTIGDVIGLFEDIDRYFTQIQAENTDDDDLIWGMAAERGHVVASKYYGLTEQANVIPAATLLHPNFRKHALTLLKWPEEWKDEAEQQLRDIFHRWYAIQAPSIEPETESQAADFEDMDTMTQQLILLHQAQAQQANANPDQAIDDWLKEPITPLGPKGERVDPLRWWWREHQKGNERGGLTAMALDVFSCPATSVDAERLFSRAGMVVTPLRHKLMAEKITEIVTLGKWFAEGSVPEDLLVNIIETQKKARAARQRKRKSVADLGDSGPSKRSKPADKGKSIAPSSAEFEDEDIEDDFWQEDEDDFE